MSAGFWENYRLADGSLDLVAALHAKRRMNTDSVRYRRAVHFLCDCEDPDNVADLTEYQCEGACEGRSFWC